jgi:2-C-methyl-D-erythritol 4-phosphate cytidylyltransferase
MANTLQDLYTVVVPAAGVGNRMGSNKPKQYLKIAGKTLLEHTLENLIRHPLIKSVVLVLSPEDTYFETTPLAKAPWINRVDGGIERADSVLAGLTHVMSTQHDRSDWVLVHDAARPCVKHEDISRLLLLRSGNVGGILAAPVKDTMKRTKPKSTCVQSTVDRNDLWHALTPQFFPAKALYNALKSGLESKCDITDEASAMEQASHAVMLIESSDSNIKVTRPDDLKLAEFYISSGI